METVWETSLLEPRATTRLGVTVPIAERCTSCD